MLTDNTTFLAYLMLHLLRCSTIIEKMLVILKPEDFNRAGEGPYGMLWDISKTWYEKQHTPLPRAALDMEIHARLEEAPGAFTTDELTLMWAELDAMYEIPDSELFPDWLLSHMQTFLDDRRVRPLIQQAANLSVGDDFQKLLEDAHIAHNAHGISRLTELDIFHRDRLITEVNERHPTGVNYVDHLFAGGTRPGELYGILAPTGGGKTTTGLAILTECARRGRHAAFFSYEVQLIPEITNRIYAMAANIPRDVFKGLKSMKDLPLTHQNELAISMDAFGRCLHTYDMKKDMHKGIGTQGPYEIREKLMEASRCNQPIDVIVIDQLLSMVDPYMLAKGYRLDQRRVHMQLCTEMLRDIAQHLNCAVVILHQTDNMTKKYSPTRRPQMGEAAEDKAFENNMHFCIQFGKADPQGRSWLKATKHRDSGDNEIIVEHSKTHWNITWQDGKYQCGSDGFYVREDFADSYRMETPRDVQKRDETMKKDVVI